MTGYGAYPGALGTALPVLGILLAAALAAYEAVYGVRHLFGCRYTKIGHKCSCPRLHRFLAGYPFHGHRQTDATFLRRAAHAEGHVSPFQKLPGWQRRLARTGPFLLVSAVLVSWPLTLAAGCAGGGFWAALRWTGKGKAVLQRVRSPQVMFGRVQAAAMAMSTAVGVSAAAVERGLQWHRDYANAAPGEVVVTWYPPRGFKATAGEKSAVEQILSARIGYGTSASWDMSAERPVMTLTRTRQMPKLVLLKDVLEKAEALPEPKMAIGLDDQGHLVCWDFSIENPHGLLNAGSRHGKTECMMGLVAQVLRKGGRVTYVDVKRVSIQGMKGTPGLTLLDNPRDMPAMWLAIAEWSKELDQRIDGRAKDPTLEFTRHLLVIEEVNQFSEMCDEFWETWPEEYEGYERTILWKPKNAKRTPPIWRVIKHGVWEGAFAKMNVLIAGQNIEYQTVKGVRNSIGMRLLGAYQPQNWKALVGTTPVPPAPPVKGRWCMINGSSQTWLQAFVADLDPNASAAIWRDYARNGRRLDGTAPPPARSTPFAVTGNGIVTRVTGNSGITSQVSASRDGMPQRVTDPRGELVSLSEAVARGYAPGATRHALHMDRHRSDKGQLPDGLIFPEVAERTGQTERFWSSEISEFNARRRGEVSAR